MKEHWARWAYVIFSMHVMGDISHVRQANVLETCRLFSLLLHNKFYGPLKARRVIKAWTFPFHMVWFWCKKRKKYQRILLSQISFNRKRTVSSRRTKLNLNDVEIVKGKCINIRNNACFGWLILHEKTEL